jgi:hypothetical protein
VIGVSVLGVFYPKRLSAGACVPQAVVKKPFSPLAVRFKRFEHFCANPVRIFSTYLLSSYLLSESFFSVLMQ